MIKVLVTGIGGPIAQGIIQGLKDRNDVRVIGADRRMVTSGHQFCDVSYVIPRYDDIDTYLDAIHNIVDKENIDIIFPSLHEEMEIYHAYRHVFTPLVALPTSDNFEILMNKEHVYQKLESLDMTDFVPEYKGFNTVFELDRINLTIFNGTSHFVVKTVDSYASLGFAFLTDRTNYLKALKNGRKNVIDINDYREIINPDIRKIAMEKLDGPEYSIDVYVHKGKMIVAVPRERTGVSNNIVLDGKVVYHERLIQYSKEITEALINDGFINLQFMEGASGFKLTDINPRFCGSQIMSLGAGVNFPSLFIDHQYLDKNVDVEPLWNTRMLRFRDQIFIHDD